jgi:hypothetical protein
VSPLPESALSRVADVGNAVAISRAAQLVTVAEMHCLAAAELHQRSNTPAAAHRIGAAALRIDRASCRWQGSVSLVERSPELQHRPPAWQHLAVDRLPQEALRRGRRHRGRCGRDRLTDLHPDVEGEQRQR